MPRWRRLVPVAVGATLVHLIADVLIPVVARHASFHLPPLLELSFWRFALILFLGYLVVIALFFLLRRVLLGGRH